MVSRRNYFSITVIMLVILFLFQFSSAAVDLWSEHDVNPHLQQELPGREDAYQMEQGGLQETAAEGPLRKQVAYIGGAESPVEKIVYYWSLYTKRNFRSFSSLQESEAALEDGYSLPEMLLVDAAGIDWQCTQDLELLEGYLEAGCPIVFCTLPEPSVIEGSERIRQLLGIRAVASQQTVVDGIHLYDGFLLGGEALYLASNEEEQAKRQNLQLEIPWYQLSSGTKVYMKGILRDAAVTSEEYPPVLWRKSFPKACVFAVNSVYMQETMGLGFLSAMDAQIDSYVLYPVVNAQNLVAANFPVLAAENGEQMKALYSRSLPDVFRDILWPSIMPAYRQSSMGLTCMLAPQLDYTDSNFPEKKRMQYYARLMHEEGAEMGLSGFQVSAVPAGQKLEEDMAFARETLPNYQLASLYAGEMTQQLQQLLEQPDLSGIHTVAAGYNGEGEVVGYLSENVTRQSAAAGAMERTYLDDLRVRCVETVLGYGHILLDLADAAYPKDENDSWERLSLDMSWNIQSYGKPFAGFQATTLSESDSRVRRFLALDYAERREGADIHLQLQNVQTPVWFILRTHGETIKKAEGGSWKELEPFAYLIEAQNAELTLTLQDSGQKMRD